MRPVNRVIGLAEVNKACMECVACPACERAQTDEADSCIIVTCALPETHYPFMIMVSAHSCSPLIRTTAKTFPGQVEQTMPLYCRPLLDHPLENTPYESILPVLRYSTLVPHS